MRKPVAAPRWQRALETWYVLDTRRHFDARTLEFLAERRVAAAETLAEEDLADRQERTVVLGANDAVSFIRIQQVRDVHAGFLHGRHHLLRFASRHAHVVRALHDQHISLGL